MKVRGREGAWQQRQERNARGGRNVCRRSPALPSHPNDTNTIDLLNAAAKEMGELRGSWLVPRKVQCRWEGALNRERPSCDASTCPVPALLREDTCISLGTALAHLLPQRKQQSLKCAEDNILWKTSTQPESPPQNTQLSKASPYGDYQFLNVLPIILHGSPFYFFYNGSP